VTGCVVAVKSHTSRVYTLYFKKIAGRLQPIPRVLVCMCVSVFLSFLGLNFPGSACLSHRFCVSVFSVSVPQLLFGSRVFPAAHVCVIVVFALRVHVCVRACVPVRCCVCIHVSACVLWKKSESIWKTVSLPVKSFQETVNFFVLYSVEGPVAGFCEHGNEPSVSVKKAGYFFDKLSD
jgi:hypothetical protein